ncbi:MAG: class IV adenylate cyclase [Ignavibacteria bacterium]|nr:class IV adenylate cyclase [Ignavibacteria bacterium]
MPVNLEIKVPVKNLKSLIDIIEKEGAKKIYSARQVDVYYKLNNGRLKIRNSSGNGEKSIIFYKRIEDGSERWSDFEVIKVDNPETWIKFFDKFLERLVVVDKHRTLYHLFNTRIHFDKVRGLGNFIELETKVVRNKNQAKKEFQKLIELLKLNPEKQILNSYSDLILNKRKS